MNFNETLLYRIFEIPVDAYKKDCLYMFILKFPALIFVVTLGTCLAIFIDFVNASKRIN